MRDVQWLLKPLPKVLNPIINGFTEQVWPLVSPNAYLQKLVFPSIQDLLPTSDKV